MKPLLFPLILMVSAISFGQNIDRNVVSSAGDNYGSTTASLSWTLGEVATESFTNTSNTLNQGFHQGNLFVSSIEDVLDLDFSIKAYPNPVLDILIIETNEPEKEYQIIKMNGEVVGNGIIATGREEVDFTRLPGGVYFISIDQKKTHKIIKQ